MIASKIFALFALAAPSFAAALVAAEDTEPITTLISTNVVATVTTTVCDLTASHPEGAPPTELPVLSRTCISGVVGTEVPSSISVVVSIIPSSIAGESGSVTIQTSTGTGNETASPANSTATPDASSHGVSTITSTATVSASGSHASESTQPSESAPPSSAVPSPSLANTAGGIKLGMLSLAIALVAGVIGA